MIIEQKDYTLKELAALVGVHRYWLSRLLKRYKITVIQGYDDNLTKRYIVSYSEVVRLLDARKPIGRPPGGSA